MHNLTVQTTVYQYDADGTIPHDTAVFPAGSELEKVVAFIDTAVEAGRWLALIPETDREACAQVRYPIGHELLTSIMVKCLAVGHRFLVLPEEEDVYPNLHLLP